MDGAPSATWKLKYAGLVVAAIGFVLTRYTVAHSVRADVPFVHFLVGHAPFLTLGLGLAAFGVALAVSRYTPRQVAVIAGWCLLGTGAMAAVLGLLHADSVLFEEHGPVFLSGEHAANVLVAGAVGGVLTGLHSAANRRQRRNLANQADRLTVLNRILRHEVLNKLNVIRGYAGLEGGIDEDRLAAIERSAERIEEAMADVGPLTRSTTTGNDLEPVSLRNVLESAVADARTAHPGSDVRVRGDVPDVTVLADAHLEAVFGHLLDNAIEHADGSRPHVRLAVDRTDTSVAIHVGDDGPGLPREQRALLREGRLPEYDDPSAGFGLTVSQLLVDRYGGRFDVETGFADDGGTVVTVTLARAHDHGPRGTSEYGVSAARLRDATAAALVAGTAMGLVLQSLFGSITVIGSLYGTGSAAVAWLTHQFHSVVFGVAFAAAVWRRSLGPDRLSVARCAGVGVAYGAVIWFVASGFVMPLWLRAVGVPAPVPSLGPINLFGHVVWGAILGGLYALLAR
jgi:signal transduction histidine kinase